jgi:hypothetical protein
MRRGLPTIMTIILLVSGGALAAGPAAAAGHWGGPAAGPAGAMVLPGGPADRMATAPQNGPAGVKGQTIVSSTNWSGYAATETSSPFTGVSASWVQPAGRCGSGDQYSAFWVGLDGYSSSTVEQTGSEVDCDGPFAEYYAWYEMYPAYPVYFNDPVKPGDHFTGTVTYQASTGDFDITLADSTEGWTATAAQTLPGATRSSAEIIAEAPSSGTSGGVLPLTNFGTVNFSDATVNGGTGLCQLNPVEITMPSVSVSSLSNCENFSVTYTGSSGGGRPPWPWF